MKRRSPDRALPVRHGHRSNAASLASSAAAPKPTGSARSGLRQWPCLFFRLRQNMRHNRIGMPVPHAMLVLQHGHQIRVPGRQARADDGLPMLDRATIFRLDGGKIGGGTFDGVVIHAPNQTPSGILVKSMLASATRLPSFTIHLSAKAHGKCALWAFPLPSKVRSAGFQAALNACGISARVLLFYPKATPRRKRLTHGNPGQAGRRTYQICQPRGSARVVSGGG